MRSKYNVSSNKIERSYKGIVFDSKMEMQFYIEVVEPKYESGEIISFELQKEYILQEKFKRNGKTVQAIKYIADFYLVYSNGCEEVIDIKGMPDNVAKLKRKLFWFKYPNVNYKWLTKVIKYGGWIEYEDYQKIKRANKR